MEHFIIVVNEFAEAEVVGPYPSADERDERAVREVNHAGGAERGANAFWLDIAADGTPTAGAFADGRW